MFNIGLGDLKLTFSNGYTLSCINKFGSYTENHFNIKKEKELMNKGNCMFDSWESKTIEIAIIKDNRFVTRDIIECDDEVKTVDMEEFIQILEKVNNLGRSW